MKRPLLLALLLAVPLEVANFFLYAFPIDVGLPDDASWFAKAMGLRWLLLHWLGLWGSNILHLPDRFLPTAFFLGGYIEVAILLYLVLLLARWLRARRRIAGQNFS